MGRYRVLRALSLASVLLLVLSACAEREPAAVSSDPEPTATSPTAATGSVAPILDFTASKLGGGQVVGAELAGKDVVVWFWAPW